MLLCRPAIFRRHPRTDSVWRRAMVPNFRGRSPGLRISAPPAPSRCLEPYAMSKKSKDNSGRMPGASRLQWRNRCGISPPSLLCLNGAPKILSLVNGVPLVGKLRVNVSPCPPIVKVNKPALPVFGTRIPWFVPDIRRNRKGPPSTLLDLTLRQPLPIFPPFTVSNSPEVPLGLWLGNNQHRYAS